MSDPANATEQAIELEKLMVRFSDALTSTVVTLDSAFTHNPELAHRPVIYQIPKMSVSVKMSLTASKGKVWGVFSKSKEDTSEEIISTITLDFVATPRAQEMGMRRVLQYTTPTTVGEDVRILQLKLQEFFKDKIPKQDVAPDGEFGLQTLQAAQAFQRWYNSLAADRKHPKITSLQANGIVDLDTYDALLKFIPDPGVPTPVSPKNQPSP